MNPTMQRGELAAYICADSEPDWRLSEVQVNDALALIYKDDYRSASLIKKVLTTGPQRAREESREEVRTIVAAVATAYAKYGDEDWRAECKHVLGSDLIEELMHTWSLFVVWEKYPVETSLYALARKTSWAVNSLDKEALHLNKHPVNVRNWRGVIALAMSGASNANYDEKSLTEFVLYAAKVHDLGPVLQLANSRNTIDVTLIDRIITQQKSIAAGLRNGSL